MPARSNASHDSSSSIRCCGSIASASLGAMPKKPASKSATSSTKPPERAYDLSGASGSGSNSPATSQPRSVGEVGHHVAPLGDHVPQALRRFDAAGEAARHADDRDRLAGALQQGAVLALQPLDLDEGFAQRLGCVLELVSHVVTPRLASIVAESGMQPREQSHSPRLRDRSSTREHRWGTPPTSPMFPIRSLLLISIAEK